MRFLENVARWFGDPAHWQGAGENDKAAAYATQAAERAYKALAFDRAAQLYRQTLVMRPPGAGETRWRRTAVRATGSAGAGASRRGPR